MQFLMMLCLSGMASICLAQGPILPLKNRQLENMASDLRVIGVLREVSSRPVGIAVLRKISDGSTVYLKEGATYEGVKVKRVERGRVELGLYSAVVQLEPVSESEELAKQAEEEFADAEDSESKDTLSEQVWTEIGPMVDDKSRKDKSKLSSADEVFDLEEKTEDKSANED